MYHSSNVKFFLTLSLRLGSSVKFEVHFFLVIVDPDELPEVCDVSEGMGSAPSRGKIKLIFCFSFDDIWY